MLKSPKAVYLTHAEKALVLSQITNSVLPPAVDRIQREVLAIIQRMGGDAITEILIDLAVSAQDRGVEILQEPVLRRPPIELHVRADTLLDACSASFRSHHLEFIWKPGDTHSVEPRFGDKEWAGLGTRIKRENSSTVRLREGDRGRLSPSGEIYAEDALYEEGFLSLSKTHRLSGLYLEKAEFQRRYGDWTPEDCALMEHLNQFPLRLPPTIREKLLRDALTKPEWTMVGEIGYGEDNAELKALFSGLGTPDAPTTVILQTQKTTESRCEYHPGEICWTSNPEAAVFRTPQLDFNSQTGWKAYPIDIGQRATIGLQSHRVVAYWVIGK